MQQGLKGLQNRAANHRRNHSSLSSSSKLGNFTASDRENWYHHEQEHDSHDDSAISLSVWLPYIAGVVNLRRPEPSSADVASQLRNPAFD